MIEIKDKGRCCGCEACRQVCPKQCIQLESDDEGFWYPVVDLDICIRCNRCKEVCPFLTAYTPKEPKQVYAAQALDLPLRMASSSGGIFTLLAEEIIRRGGVIFGARFDKDWGVLHDYTDTREGLPPFRGSKYVQSRIGNSYLHTKQFLKEGREVLFSGTPCQIRGLINYLGREYDNLTTIDIVCHGVPSPRVWREYRTALLQSRDKKSDRNSHFTNISFRNKDQSGWRHYEFTAEMVASSLNNNPEAIKLHTVHQLNGSNLYMRGFLHNLYLRPSCYHCMVKGGRSLSDLTLGDYWGIERVCQALDDDKGTSLVLIHNERGRKLFNSVQCSRVETSYSGALAGNPSIEDSVVEPQARGAFFEQIQKESDLQEVITRLTATPIRTRLWRFIRRHARKVRLLRSIKRMILGDKL